MEATLFGPKYIKSVSYSDAEILNDIIQLYTKAPFHCDCTFSVGQFYVGVPLPKLKFDINPQLPGVVKSCSTNLPLESGSIKSMMFDPVFMASWNVESYAYKMEKRFGRIKGINNLLNYYEKSIVEFARVIKRYGYLIIKCQDLGYGGANYFNHIFLYEVAKKNNFKAMDLFIKVAKNRFKVAGKQKVSRKYHSYFWVFKKVK